MNLTVDQLLAKANRRIDEMGVVMPERSRAGQYIDLRTFRYYRSQKLLDPPNDKDGTAGLYGERHMWQLVAIKAMQASWMPISEIRNKLASASDEQLTAIAHGTDAPVKRSTGQRRTDQPTRQWVELRLGDEAFAMVSPDVLGSAKPSALRAIGERLVAQLLAEHGRLQS